jgi:hypothetical protein
MDSKLKSLLKYQSDHNKVKVLNSDRIFEDGYSQKELKDYLGKSSAHIKRLKLDNNKYFLYKIISEKPFKIKFRLFNVAGIIKDIILRLNKETALKIAIILGLEDNCNDDGMKYLISEKDEHFPRGMKDWNAILRIIRKHNLKTDLFSKSYNRKK